MCIAKSDGVNRFDFQEGLGCHIYVEKAHYESNNGFAGKFKSGRRVAMCPGCLGPPGEQSAVDEQKTWSVRICDACKRDGPGGLLAYQGQAPRKRGAAADPTDDDEQPYFFTTQLIPRFSIISRHPSSRLGTHTREAYRRSYISRNMYMFPPPPFILAPEEDGHFGNK